MNPYNTTGTVEQGQSFFQNGVNQGAILFDARTGRRLAKGEKTTLYPRGFNPASAGSTMNAMNLEATPFNIPQVEPTSTTGGLGMLTDSTVANANSLPEPVQTPQQETQGYLKGLIKKISGTSEEINQINQDEQVAEKKAKAKALSTELDTMDKAFRDEVKMIRENAGGLTASGVQGQVAQAQDRYQNNRANAALSYKIAADDYNGAAEIANSKIQALKDENAQGLQAYQLLVDSINNDLTESQKLEAQFQIDKKKGEAKTLEDAYALALTAGTENKASAAYFQAIDEAKRTGNPTAISQVVGDYGFKTLDQQENEARIESINADIRKKNSEARGFEIPEVSSNAAQYQGALKVILGSDKFTKEQKAAIINAVNTGEDPFAVVKNQAKNIMGSTLAKELDNAETSKSQLQSIDSLLTQYYANGGKTGIFTGNFEKTLNKLGEVNKPELVEIATELAIAMQEYRLAVTGTAASIQEDAKIESIFPGINSSEGLNKAKLAGLLKSFDQRIDSKYTNVLGNTYSTLKNLNGAQLSGASTGVKTVKAPNGNTYNVGEVYQDGTGARWTVDASGKWTKQ